MTESGVLTSPSGLAASQHVHHVVRRSGTSFLWGMRVLPKARREAMYAIYAFCREVDDVADEPGAEADKLAALEAWRGEIERLYAGHESSSGIEVSYNVPSTSTT